MRFVRIVGSRLFQPKTESLIKFYEAKGGQKPNGKIHGCLNQKKNERACILIAVKNQ